MCNAPIKKSSDLWLREYGNVKLIDPDGWNRNADKFDYDFFQREITEQEFKTRLYTSTTGGDWKLRDVKTVPKPRVEFLVGMIASGKSTYAKKRAEQGALIINDDAIVNALHANSYTAYTDDLKTLYKAIEMTIFHHGIALGRDIIVDRPNFMPSTRRRYIEVAKSLDVKEIMAIVMPLDSLVAHASRRATADGRGHDFDYWKKVVDYHHSLLVQPTIDEGFTKIVHRVWES